MKIINKTPHDVNIMEEIEGMEGSVKAHKKVRVYESDGKPIRLTMETVPYDIFPDGTLLTHTTFGEVDGLPEEEEGVFYIVSQMVKSALSDRGDLLVPAEIVRDGRGVIIGCKSLGI